VPGPERIDILLTVWLSRASCTELLRRESACDISGRVAGIGYAGNTRNVGSPPQDKNTQRVFAQLSAKRTVTFFKLSRT
jgi:hypothetical protein